MHRTAAPTLALALAFGAPGLLAAPVQDDPVEAGPALDVAAELGKADALLKKEQFEAAQSLLEALRDAAPEDGAVLLALGGARSRAASSMTRSRRCSTPWRSTRATRRRPSRWGMRSSNRARRTSRSVTTR